MAYNNLLSADRVRLQTQLAMLYDLDEKDYPNLHHLFHRTRAFRTLEAVFGVMGDMDNALHVSHEGKLFFAISERYLMRWWDTHRQGAPLGSTSTWHSSLILLIHCGLLKRIVASDQSIVPNFRAVYDLARQKNFRVENILYVPTYMPEVLQTAEGCIHAQRKTSSLHIINKESIILSSGQETADRLYLDGREVTWMTQFVLREMSFRIRKTIVEKGYVKRTDLLQQTGDALIRHTGYIQHCKQNILRRKVEQLWKQYNKSILRESGATYRRPTAQEKRQFALECDAWIIR